MPPGENYVWCMEKNYNVPLHQVGKWGRPTGGEYFDDGITYNQKGLESSLLWCRP